jgi:hypothetical protein
MFTAINNGAKQMTFETEITGWVKSKIDAAEARTNWSKLPASFEADAVKSVFTDIKPHFSKLAIKARIAASRATTFADLRDAIK